jgi:DNA-binding NarL/FixJ family response regulator
LKLVRVALQATDPLTRAGLASYLGSCPELTLLDSAHRTDAEVLVLAEPHLTVDVVAALRRPAAEIGAPIVLVADEITETELLTALECRVVAVVPRPALTSERLVNSVLAAAAGGGVMPPNLVGELLKHIKRLQRDGLMAVGLSASGLSQREIAVLRLMADGLDTTEIARELSCSERTVKNVIYGLMRRLKLRNRSHAVAYGAGSTGVRKELGEPL